jgi:cellulose 1,4-beta-cellobiosidase
MTSMKSFQLLTICALTACGSTADTTPPTVTSRGDDAGSTGGHAADPDANDASPGDPASSGDSGPSGGGSKDAGTPSGDGSKDAGLSGGGTPGAHVANPFAGARFYVDSAWSANVLKTAGKTSDAKVAAQLKTVAGYSTAVWLDDIERIAPTDGTMGLEAHLDAALAQQSGATPVAITLVIYDLPGRDCAALASNGTLPATAAGLETYKRSYIDPIAAVLRQPKYAPLRVVTIVEPDSLPNIVTNASTSACATAGPLYEQGVEYALETLHAVSNVYTYLDSGHSGWLGWTSNSGPAAQEFAKVARATSAGFASIDGFITDTANYTPVHEPFIVATQQIGGQPADSAKFYQFNPDLDEAAFAADMYTKLTAAGFPSTIGMLIDTSRNGWGGAKRPASASTSADLNAFVTASKVDRRAHRGLWCNVAGAGLGAPPQASPPGYEAAHLAAFIWVKPPGESDGTSAATVNGAGKKSDPMCDPSFTTSAGVLTGAMPSAPLAGQWFAAQLTQLVENAYPQVP